MTVILMKLVLLFLTFSICRRFHCSQPVDIMLPLHCCQYFKSRHIQRYKAFPWLVHIILAMISLFSLILSISSSNSLSFLLLCSFITSFPNFIFGLFPPVQPRVLLPFYPRGIIQSHILICHFMSPPIEPGEDFSRESKKRESQKVKDKLFCSSSHR